MTEEIKISSERFFQRLERLQAHWFSHKNTAWGGADGICFPSGSATGEETTYSKSASISLYLFGYEFPDSIMLITQKGFYFMAAPKKCGILEKNILNTGNPISVHIYKKEKDDGMNRENFHNLMNAVRTNGGKKLGMLIKGEYKGNFVPLWMKFVEESHIETCEVASALGLYFVTKDDIEQDLCKRASVLTNKVMKHGFVSEMQNILENDTKMTHEALATKVERIIYDPNLINVKVASDVVESCYTPIIQSGGKYDIKVSAQSNVDNLSPDIIICSIGARYKSYCANLTRTFTVDAPMKVEKAYATLLGLYDACMEQMVPGHELKDVCEAARAFVAKKDPTLLSYLPKSFGFAIGIEFRDATLILNEKNTTKFSDGMTFVLSVGLQNVPLLPADKVKVTDSFKKMETFSLLVADTVRIQQTGVPEILTKCAKDFSEVSYNIADQAEEEGEGDAVKVEGVDTEDGVRRSSRSAAEKQANESAAAQRSVRQTELMKKKLAEARRRMEKADGRGGPDEEEDEEEVSEIQAYQRPADFPRDASSTQIRVDMEKECLLVPISGRPVPFHISVIKNVSMPEQDRATWMRINFYVSGVSLGKDVPKNVQQLVVKHGETAVFIKELTYRSLDSKNLNQVFQHYQELRKRIKQREQKAEQEKDLVIQTKLIRIKDQRVPRLQDLTMRPQISGRKCMGALEAHQNGLRFLSNKGEILDIMYANIKHCIYQPCDRTTMVLVHFHLKDFIMIGKKKQKDVQFFAEVVDVSQNLESSRRSTYDPDELDDEQREREMKKRLNVAFKEFCQKVEKVAAHYDFNLQVDVPFKKSGFEGNPHKEMVALQPTTHCLVNLTETPFFLVTLSEIDHAHFERVTYATKNFDLVLVFKDYSIPPRMVTAIDVKSKDLIQDWLNLVEITYTEGPMSLNWNQLMETVRQDVEAGIFFLDKDEAGVKKPAGWLILSVEDEGGEEGEEEEDDGDSEFEGEEEDSEEEDDDSEEEEDSDFDDEDDDDDDEEEQDEEDADNWEDLEKQALAADRAKRTYEEEPSSSKGGPSKKAKSRR